MRDSKGRLVTKARGTIGWVLALLLVVAIAFSYPAKGQAPLSTDPALASLTPSPDARPLPVDRGSAAVWQMLLKLHTRASLIMVVAHPDDEDGGMLTYESRGHGVRAMMLTLNRGEGGQNVMSDDFFDALGLVRTQELLSADRYSDVQQFFSSVIDFGFSKSREEALSQWDHDRVLADAVRVVRMTRPLVVTSVFVGGPSDGHGHHSVAGQMAQEVFTAAGDPKMFPEQIRDGLRPWSPLKVYARAPLNAVTDRGIFDSATGKYVPPRFFDFVTQKWVEGPLPVNIQIPEGTYDPVLGGAYIQVAREGLALQKSQNGGGRLPQAGPANTAYHRFGSLVPAQDKEQSFFDGIDVSLAGIADLAQGQQNQFLKDALNNINTVVEKATSEFAFDHPEKIAPLLADGLKQTNALAMQVSASGLSDQAKYDVLHELTVKQGQFQQAIVDALGVTLEATVQPAGAGGGRGAGGPGGGGGQADFTSAVPGQQLAVRVHLNNPTQSPLALDRVWLETPAGENWSVAAEPAAPASLAAAQALDQRFNVKVPDEAAPTRPYFSRPNDEQPYYDIVDQRYRDLPLPPYPVAAWMQFNYEGAAVRTGQVVQNAKQENGFGQVLNPLLVTPAVSVRIAPQAGITPLGSKSFALSALLHAEAENGASGTVKLNLPTGWHSEPASAPFEMKRAGEERNVDFQVFPDKLEQKPYTVAAEAEAGGKQYHEGFITIGYPGLRPYNLYMPATYKTTGVDFKMSSGLRIGYVMGTGDAVPQSLENLGVKVEQLSPWDVAHGDLAKYDEIVFGVRAYAARPELAMNTGRLLDYVKDGGVIVVQYATAEFNRNYGPYPYELSTAQEHTVTDEKAPVNFVDPNSPVLNWPNRITANDFSGWVEERGHSFLVSWDPHYQAPLETHDMDQDPQKGGLIYTQYGKGVYAYVAFALYRQLPDGVPGAYRLFANLLSLPRNPAFKPTTKTTAASPARGGRAATGTAGAGATRAK